MVFEDTLVRVTKVKVQNRNGAIIRGERIAASGEILDTHELLTARIHARGLGIQVKVGQWWKVRGKVTPSTFINRHGFRMTEQQMEVRPGDAQLQRPEGEHVIDYLKRNTSYKGIGEVTARQLWETFGTELFSILDEEDTTALADVIGHQRASMLVQAWKEEGLSGSLQWLHCMGVPLVLGRKILDYFKVDLVAKVEEDPYRLLSFAVGWDEVDAFARAQLGLAEDDPRRLLGAAAEAVYSRFSQGDTYVPRKALEAGMRALLAKHLPPAAQLDVGAELVASAIEQSEASRRLLFDREGNAYSLGASILENQAAEFIVRKACLNSSPQIDVDRIIWAYEDRESIGMRSNEERFTLNPEQRAAMHLVAENDLAVITGGAGCGKTTVLKGVFDVLDEQGYQVVQLALSGKAARRMSDATKRPASTLASFIKNGTPTGPLAVVIDEASMVDLLSFAGVIRQLPDDAKMVQVGDPHQLPPVGPGLILHCVADLPFVPHVELKAPKRFGNKLAQIANQIKDGVFPALDQFNDELQFIQTGSKGMIDLASKIYLEKPHDSIVLCTTRTFAKTVNLLVQRTLTSNAKPLKLWNTQYESWEIPGFNEGDLVLCTRNHWDLGVQNGSIGRLIEVFDPHDPMADDPEASTPEGPRPLGRIDWDDGEVRFLTDELLDNLELGYAITIHKSQGSQWRRVIACLPAESRSADRSMIYTAITRSQGELVILGEHLDLVAKVKREKAADRRLVGLRKRLEFLMRERGLFA